MWEDGAGREAPPHGVLFWGHVWVAFFLVLLFHLGRACPQASSLGYITKCREGCVGRQGWWGESTGVSIPAVVHLCRPQHFPSHSVGHTGLCAVPNPNGERKQDPRW